MATAIVTSKGQITIPIEVREKLRLEAGDRVEFVEIAEGQFSIVAATEDVSSLRGCVKAPTRKVTVEDMNRAIRRRGGRP